MEPVGWMENFSAKSREPLGTANGPSFAGLSVLPFFEDGNNNHQPGAIAMLTEKCAWKCQNFNG